MRIRRSWMLAALLLAAGLAMTAIPSAIATNAGRLDVREPRISARVSGYASDRVVVKYRDEAAKQDAVREQLVDAAGGTIRRQFAAFPAMASIALDGRTTVEEAIAVLSADPRVEFAEPSYFVELHGVPNDEH
ncbi:MAG: hypothetical protein IT175_17390, partial [Acidobacteria bacterium]|nr:hypothetical protein [Acidobacteriota bacterium]